MARLQSAATLLIGLLAFAATTTHAATTTTTPTTTTTVAPGTKGDPIFSGFDGSTYSFDGEAFSYYNILSDASHTLNAFFTPAVMHDHNGTYIHAFGFTYDIHRLAVHVQEDGALAVELNGQALSMSQTETALTIRLSNRKNAAAGTMTVTWDRFHPKTGATVEVVTPTVTFVAYSVAPGTVDEGGVVQPAYLDSKVTLTAAPVGNQLQGVLGDSYTRLVEHVRDGKAIPSQRFNVATADKQDLKAANLFDTAFAASLFGSQSASSARRMLSETLATASSSQSVVTFPITGASFGVHT